MRIRPLLDEQSKQANQCRELGADLYLNEETEDEADCDEVGWGSDPFDILAHREEQGGTQ